MTIQDMPTAELAVLSNKFLSYMQQVEAGVQKLTAISTVKTVMFDTKPKIELLKSKFEEAAKVFNEIQLEIEKRCEDKTGFSFESQSISQLMFEVDKIYFELQKQQAPQ